MLLLTNCRSDLSRSGCSFLPVVGCSLFSSARDDFAFRAVSAFRRRCLRVRLSRSPEGRTHATCALRALGFVKILSVSTSCSLVHVLTHVFLSACSLARCSSARTFARCAWSTGLTSTTLLSLPALCLEVRVSRALLLRSSSRSFVAPLFRA